MSFLKVLSLFSTFQSHFQQKQCYECKTEVESLTEQINIGAKRIRFSLSSESVIAMLRLCGEMLSYR